MDKLMRSLNGNGAGAFLVRIFYEVVIVLGVLWMFCQVRDFPAVYLTKAEAQTLKEELRGEFGRVNAKLDNIEAYLRRQ